MIDVVVVSCKLNNCIYYLSPNDLELNYNDEVIFEDNGDYLVGNVIKTKYSEKKENLFLPLVNVVRLVNSEDKKKLNKNADLADKALAGSIPDKSLTVTITFKILPFRYGLVTFNTCPSSLILFSMLVICSFEIGTFSIPSNLSPYTGSPLLPINNL